MLGRIAFMDEEHNDTLEEKLDKLTELVEKDHELIRGMYTRARWASFFRIVYWAVIVLAAFGAYVWLQPYVDNLKGAIDSFNQFRLDVSSDDGFVGKILKVGSTK